MKKLLVSLVIVSGAVGMHKPAPVARIDKKKQEQLVKAVSENKIDEVRRLLRFKPLIDVNAKDSNSDRPLDKAVDTKNVSIAELLLVNGADPNRRKAGGLTPGYTLLMEAVARNDAPMVELLLYHGADRDATFNDNRAQGGSDRKAINFIRGRNENTVKIRGLLGKQKLP